MRFILFLLGFLGALLFIGASIWGGLQIEGYDPISQFISESYAAGIPNAGSLQKVFMISGLLLASFGFLAPMGFPNSLKLKVYFVLFALFYGVGTVVTAYFPCDLGCVLDPENPSISQLIHNTMGLLTYVVVPFCLLGIGVELRKKGDTSKLPVVSLICGSVALAFVVFLFGNPEGPFIGLFQRIVEGSILSWTLFCASLFLKSSKT